MSVRWQCCRFASPWEGSYDAVPSRAWQNGCRLRDWAGAARVHHTDHFFGEGFVLYVYGVFPFLLYVYGFILMVHVRVTALVVVRGKNRIYDGLLPFGVQAYFAIVSFCGGAQQMTTDTTHCTVHFLIITSNSS